MSGIKYGLLAALALVNGVEAMNLAYDYRVHPVTAADPLGETNWRGCSPAAAVDGVGGGSPWPFAYRCYIRRPWLSDAMRKGHPDTGGAGWLSPWTPDCSETGAPSVVWPARLLLDYGTPVPVAQLAIYFPRRGNGDTYLTPTAYAASLQSVEVLRSDDGITWESSVRIPSLPQTSPQIIVIPAPKPSRYYILSVESMSLGNDALRIYEVETYTDPDAKIETEDLFPAPPAPPAGERSQSADPNPSSLPDRYGFQVTQEGFDLSWKTERGAIPVSVSATPDGKPGTPPWNKVDSHESTLQADVEGGSCVIHVAPGPQGLHLTVRMPPLEGRARRFIYLRFNVPDARVRFIPAYLWSREPVKSAWPGHWLPTCMAAIETSTGTFFVAPDSDQCRIGIQGDDISLCLFPGPAAASTLLSVVDGDWWKAYQSVVTQVDKFTKIPQLRPASQAAFGITRWLMGKENWSETWGMQRSFPAGKDFYPEKEFFFILYGVPYSIPALWQRFLLTGDEEARKRLDGIAEFLIDSPARVQEGPMKGGYYSTLAGSRNHYRLIDQAYNGWMTSQASGAALWSLIYHRKLLENPSDRLDKAIQETADFLVKTQTSDGGWVYAHWEQDGTILSATYTSSGAIWNLWALHQAGCLHQNQNYLEAAQKGRDWWCRTFLDNHYCQGYWEDSNGLERIHPTREGYEFSLAVLAFLEMEDRGHALEAAKNLACWVQTRTPDYRDSFTSLGNIPEQFTWPGDAYIAPQAGFALQQIMHSTEDSFWKPYSEICKTISWWCEEDTGAMFFPLEAAAFLPLDKGELTKTYWGDWCGAQCSSRTIWWLADAINSRSLGKIAVDRDRLKGTLFGAPCSARIPDSLMVKPLSGSKQLNWMGYESESGFHLALLNDDEQTAAEISVTGLSENLQTPPKITHIFAQLHKIEEPPSEPENSSSLHCPPESLTVVSWDTK